jgi:dipeptidyl aminopeptidase/acylaminoacyl peptidase
MEFRAKVLPRERQTLIIAKRNLGGDHGRTSYMKLGTERGLRPMQMPARAMYAGFALIAGSAFAAPGSTLQHVFMEAVSSPDGRHVVSVEGDASLSGGSPIQRDLVIRSMDGKTTTVVDLPCGKVAQCWPAAPAWTPDSRKVSFALRVPGSHARSLYQVNADGGEVRQLAAFDGTIADLRYGAHGELAMLATAGATKELSAVEAGAAVTGDLDEAPPEQRIAILDAGKLRFTSPPQLFVYEFDWRPDGHGFVGTAAPGDGDKNWWVAKLYAFDATHGASRVLYTPSSAQQQLAMPMVSRDGKRVAFIAGIMSDFGSTGGDIYTVPLAGGTAVNITPKLPASVSAIRWDCNGHLLAAAIAGDKTELVDFGNGEAGAAGKLLWQGQELLGTHEAQLAGDCPSGIAAIVHQSFNHAAEIEIGAIGKWHDLTHANVDVTAPFKVQSLSWKSDEFSVQGWLILPQEIAAGMRLPLVTIVHGGPASAVVPEFIGAGSARQLLEHGYAVFLPNPRGSYGQGEAFTAANVRDFGYGDLRDILAGVDATAHAGPIDPERVGIMGHSYGGFMTMWAVTQSNRFKAAVAGAGIANWQSYYGENGIDEWLIPYFGASVYEDPAVYAKSSPISFIRQTHTPTFSYVGAADIECPAAQTLEFGHALKVLGVPSVTVIYPDEGHAIHDPAHLADRSERTLDWFDRYLK